MSKLQIGDKAPEINAVDQNGNKITLEQYQGKKVVLYFYPKDMTPGCTAQSCNLSDNYNVLQKNGYDVIGVSCDSIKRHQKFIEKYSLPFNLISDEDQKVVNDYGVWQLKKFMGREYMGIVRTTFIIDEKGLIIDIITKVKDTFNVPTFAYQVSGEYSMLKSAINNQWLESDVIIESLLCFKRAGADAVLTYAAKEIIKELN